MPMCISTGIQVTCVIISTSQHSHTNTNDNSIIEVRRLVGYTTMGPPYKGFHLNKAQNHLNTHTLIPFAPTHG